MDKIDIFIMSEYKNDNKEILTFNAAIEKVIFDFNEIINNPKTYRAIAVALEAIISYSKCKHLWHCDTKVLEQLRLNIHRFKIAIADYLNNIDSDINKIITEINNANRPLEDMSKEELIAYIKSKENTSK